MYDKALNLLSPMVVNIKQFRFAAVNNNLGLYYKTVPSDQEQQSYVRLADNSIVPLHYITGIGAKNFHHTMQPCWYAYSTSYTVRYTCYEPIGLYVIVQFNPNNPTGLQQFQSYTTKQFFENNPTKSPTQTTYAEILSFGKCIFHC